MAKDLSSLYGWDEVSSELGAGKRVAMCTRTGRQVSILRDHHAVRTGLLAMVDALCYLHCSISSLPRLGLHHGPQVSILEAE